MKQVYMRSMEFRWPLDSHVIQIPISKYMRFHRDWVWDWNWDGIVIGQRGITL